MKHWKKACALLLVCGGFGTYYWVKNYSPAMTLTQQESTRVEDFLKDMQPRCVGRYLIDLPASFTVTSDNVMAFIDDAPVRTKKIYRPAFEQKIRLREESLKNTKTVNELNMPYLKKIYKIPDGMEGVIFERNKNASVPDSSRVLEAHLYTNGVAIEIEMKARNGLASRYDEDRKILPEIYGNTVPEKLERLTLLLKRMSGRSDTDKPAGPGLCLPEVFIADDGSSQKEVLSLGYTSILWPEISFDFDTDNYISSDDSLLERSSEMEKIIGLSKGETLQKGKKTVNGIYTEEWLVTGNVSWDMKGLRFVLNANEKTGGPLTPNMNVSYLQRNFSENQPSQNGAIAFWEKITNTLRIRPGAFINQ